MNIEPIPRPLPLPPREHGLTATQALELARDLHDGQADKSGRPYWHHLMCVQAMVAEYGEDAQIVAAFHDVLEDTDTTLAQLEAILGQETLWGAVIAITRRREQRYRDYIEQVARNDLARVVKIADLRHNLSPARMEALDTDEARGLRKRYVRSLARLEGGYDVL